MKSPWAKLRPMVGWGVLLCAACRSPLPNRPDFAPAGGAATPDAFSLPHLRFEPPAAADAVHPITRIVVEVEGAASDPRVLLLEGSLSVPQLRDFARPPIPQTLASRAVGAVVWADADRSLVVVAPLSALKRGSPYTLALDAPLASFPFSVSADVEGRPSLARIWPDHDQPTPNASAAVWCGDEDLAPLDVAATLEPASIPGHFNSGAGSPVPMGRCITWFADRPLPPVSDLRAAQAVAPSSLTLDDGSRVALEPTLFWPRDLEPASASPCDPPEIPFGLGCAEVEDDRAIVRSAAAPLLWTIEHDGESLLKPTHRGESFVLRPLPADGRYRIGTLDMSGRTVAVEVAVAPAPARSHLVLNEVMANPAGAEPAEEWVELFNDGSDEVSLAGFSIEDSGARTVLPALVLPAAAFALVVRQDYLADDGVDPPPADGTLLVRVAALGRSGLTNEGERLTLRDPADIVISSFPAVKTKTGVSVARVAADAPDSDPASFEPSPNGSATPGAANRGR